MRSIQLTLHQIQSKELPIRWTITEVNKFYLPNVNLLRIRLMCGCVAVNVVIVSRLVYRKGVDLMAGVIAKLVNMKNVHFIIGGDGPKRSLLEEIREKKNLQNRVTLLGPLEHSKVTRSRFSIQSESNGNFRLKGP